MVYIYISTMTTSHRSSPQPYIEEGIVVPPYQHVTAVSCYHRYEFTSVPHGYVWTTISRIYIVGSDACKMFILKHSVARLAS